MAISQNGYIACREELMRTFIIPGCERHIRLRRDAPGWLLIHFATWYDRKIEKLDQGIWDEWGYNCRPIRDGNEFSNHASGTAEDLNATRHPMGVNVRQNLSEAQINRINRRLRLYGGCIVWGGNWSRPDGMHYEIGQPLKKVRRRWRILRLSPIGREIRRVNNG